MNERSTMHALFRGRVQGVGFRATAYYHAKKLGLTGTVCNLMDGSVEMYAQGPKQRLEELVEKLREEIGANRIREAIIEYVPLNDAYEDFRIIYK